MLVRTRRRSRLLSPAPSFSPVPLTPLTTLLRCRAAALPRSCACPHACPAPNPAPALAPPPPDPSRVSPCRFSSSSYPGLFRLGTIIRSRVFVSELSLSEVTEFDAFDETARHALCLIGDAPVGYGRWRYCLLTA
jgi:hypothetical protein